MDGPQPDGWSRRCLEEEVRRARQRGVGAAGRRLPGVWALAVSPLAHAVLGWIARGGPLRGTAGLVESGCRGWRRFLEACFRWEKAQGTGGRRDRRLLVLALLLAMTLAPRLWFAVSGRHFWDENFWLRNTARLLSTRQWEPQNGYYPLVSYLPHAAVVGTLEAMRSRFADLPPLAAGELELTDDGVLVCRLVQAAISFALVAVSGWVALRWFGAWGAALAIVALGTSPTVIRTSGYLKPDGLLALAVVVALATAARAGTSGRWTRVAGAGCCAGLAVSAKLTGAPILAAVPVALIAGRRRWRERWRDLGVAAVAAVGTYRLLAPHWRSNLHYAEVAVRQYARKARHAGLDRLDGIEQTLDMLLAVQGPLLVLLALGGALLLAMSWRRGDVHARARAAVLLTFPWLFVAFYFGRTPYFKDNNLLPLVPVLVLWAAAAVGPALAAAARGGEGWRRVVAASLAAVIATWAVSGGLFLYRRLVPTTWDKAHRMARRSLGEADRLVLAETPAKLFPPWQREAPPRQTWWTVERLDRIPGRLLDRADWEVFPAARLAGPDGRAHRRRLRAVKGRHVLWISPEPFGLRGPSLVVLHHPWRRVEAVRPGDERGGLLRSAVVRLPTEYLRRHPEPRLRLKDGSVRLHPVIAVRGGHLLATGRWAAERWPEDPAVEPSCAEALVRIVTWRRQPRFWRRHEISGPGGLEAGAGAETGDAAAGGLGS